MVKKAVILIIGENPDTGENLAGILKSKDYNVLAARNGEEGLLLMRENAVDLTLMDLGLAGIPGLSVLSEIKAVHPFSAAIILTGKAALQSAIKATSQGVFSYLVKPCEIDQLLLQIRLALEKKRADEALLESEAQFRGLLESTPGGAMIVNARNEILIVNNQFEAMFGYSRAEIIGKNVEMLVPARYIRHGEHHKGYIQNPAALHLGSDKELYALRKDGTEFPVDITLSPLETPGGLMISAIIRDISERKNFEAQLKYQANHDSLTGLPNRTLLMDRLNQALLFAERHRQKVAVLFIDLDHFQFINDSLGHETGDRLLKIVAERLASCVRSNDTVARQGGDDFIIVLSDLTESEDAALVAQHIQAAVNQPIAFDGHDLKVSCSIGISIHPKDGKDVQALLKNADTAMFRAKDQGRGSFQFFTDELNRRLVARTSLERSLSKAFEEHALSVHYQPQIDLASGRMIGTEALLRWQDPETGMVPPAMFIPLAEETGLIIAIGEQVLRTSCMQARQWQDAGLPPLTIAVNLSPRQFWDPTLIDTITRALKDSGLDPRYLELEIIESMVIREEESTMAMLHTLKEMGVQLSMDDFGTGYSNLNLLKRFPFDKLKMDISFVREVTCDPGSAAIARTIIAMGHNLNLKVIAEGVETEGQLCYLRGHGCDEMQGFYFSRPLPAGDFELLLREDRRFSFPRQESIHPEKTVLLIDDEQHIIDALKRGIARRRLPDTLHHRRPQGL